MNYSSMKRSETTEQIRLFRWAEMNEEFIPELKLLYHVPNEGKRSQQSGKILKAAGLKPGVPDVCLPVSRDGYSALFIEMKYGKNKESVEQTLFITELEVYGHNKCVICYSAEQAREVIRHYLRRGEGFDLVNCEHAPKFIINDKHICDGVHTINGLCEPCLSCRYHV